MRSAIILLASLGFGSCVGPPRSAPVPQSPPPIARPTQAPIAPPPVDWVDRPFSTGEWRFGQSTMGSQATFDSAGVEIFSIRCEQQMRSIVLHYPGEGTLGGAEMTVRTTNSTKSYPASVWESLPFAQSRLSVSDAQLDAMAFTRGRFMISLTGRADLILRAAPEVTRVIEDCRG